MKITCWSDFVCPYCFIGKTRLKRVLKEMGLFGQTEFIHKSFRLHKEDLSCPRCRRERNEESCPKDVDTVSWFAEKYGISYEESRRQIDTMSRMGREEGIEVNYASVKHSDTMDAHRLMKFVIDRGGAALGEVLEECLFTTYFTYNMDIADPALLKRMALGLGLSEGEIDEVLSTDLYGPEVMMDCLKAGLLGIHMVPCFIIDDSYYISGAQPAEDMRSILSQASLGK